MTKTEIAYQLATQYAKVENEMFQASELRDELRKTSNPDKSDLQWIRNDVKRLRSNMNTIRESKDLLGISDKTWFEAITKAYIANSNLVEA